MMHSTGEFRRIWLPYVIKKMADPVGGWIVLNRGYKPVGYPTEGWVDYEDVPKSVRIKQVTLPQQKKLFHGSGLGSFRPDDMIFLYHDRCIPSSSICNWKAYQERLFLLSRLDCFGGTR